MNAVAYLELDEPEWSWEQRDALVAALNHWRDRLRLDLLRTHGTPEYEIHQATADRLLEVARIVGIADGESTI